MSPPLWSHTLRRLSEVKDVTGRRDGARNQPQFLSPLRQGSDAAGLFGNSCVVSMRLTILGCGSSGGVPRIGGFWGACDPANPRNRRRRCSVLVERKGATGSTRVLIDTSPDLREQLLSAGAAELDGVVYTHAHADHTHGIDELRAVALNTGSRVPVWADEATADRIAGALRLRIRGGRRLGLSADPRSYRPVADRCLCRFRKGGRHRARALCGRARQHRVAGLPYRRHCLHSGSQRRARAKPRGAVRARLLDRGRAAAPTTSQPLVPRRDA